MGSDENNEHASIDVKILAHVRTHMLGGQNVYTVEAEDINVPGTINCIYHMNNQLHISYGCSCNTNVQNVWHINQLPSNFAPEF